MALTNHPRSLTQTSLLNYILAVVSMGIAGLFSIIEARSEGFWGDELWTIHFISLSMSDMLVATAEDVHPRLYYLIVKVWVELVGFSPFLVRGLSILFGLAAIFTIYTLGARIYTQRTGSVAALLSAFAIPMLIQMAQARMYALLIFVTALSYLFFWELLAGSHRPTIIIGYVLATVGMLYTHLYGALLLCSQVLIALSLTITHTGLTTAGKKFWRQWIPIGGLIGVLALPLIDRIIRMLRSMKSLQFGFVHWIARADANFLHLFEWLVRPYPVAIIGLLWLVALIRIQPKQITNTITIPVSFDTDQYTRLVFFGGWYVFTLLQALVLSAIIQPLFYYRFAIPLLVPVFIVTAYGITNIKSQLFTVLIIAVLVVFGVQGGMTLVSTQGLEPTDEAMEFVNTHATKNDALYVESWGPELIRLYANESTPPLVTNLETALSNYDQVWVITATTRTLPSDSPSWNVTWWKFKSSGPYRSRFEGNHRVWWVGRIADQKTSESLNTTRSKLYH
ncbi:MAG: hypothetical protein ABEI06_09030 [Halobacteriaceae archaeon]